MKSKIFLRLIILSFAVFGAFGVCAAGLTRQEASSWAEEKGNLLLDAFAGNDLAVKYARLDELFLNYVDLDYVGKFVVGKYWKTMTPGQKTEYLELFRRYALGLYKTFPLSFNHRIGFQIIRTVVKGNDADVTAQIRFQGMSEQDPLQNLLLEFKLRKTADGIKILDLKLAESSLILSYRSRFYAMIAEDDGDMTWFLEDFRTSVESIERTNQLRLEKEFPYPEE